MNAVMAVQSNRAGLANPTPAQREEARVQLEANARAHQLGSVLKGDAVAKVQEAQKNFGQQELGRDAFLQLLLLEIQNQDPLDPIGNTEMLAQLAQFSALEQMQHVANNLETLAGNIDQLNFINAANLLGREVLGIGMDGNLLQGTVQHVQLDGSVVILTVNDQLMSMAGVQSIRSGPAQ